MPKSPFLHLLPALALCLLAAADLAAREPVDIEQYREAAVKRWEGEMAKFDALNASETHPGDSILFIGSSSIRKWEDIAADMAPYHPIPRGFGGSNWADVAVYADRLITPHAFRAVVFFLGNDISGKETDKTPAEVAGLFEYVLGKVRAHNPTAPVFYIAVTPSPKRWEAWPRIKAANSAARAVCEKAEHAYFIGTESIYLDADGQPRPELFLADALHQNRDGYIRWTAAIKAHLDAVLGGAGG